MTCTTRWLPVALAAIALAGAGPTGADEVALRPLASGSSAGVEADLARVVDDADTADRLGVGSFLAADFDWNREAVLAISAEQGEDVRIVVEEADVSDVIGGGLGSLADLGLDLDLPTVNRLVVTAYLEPAGHPVPEERVALFLAAVPRSAVTGTVEVNVEDWPPIGRIEVQGRAAASHGGPGERREAVIRSRAELRAFFGGPIPAAAAQLDVDFSRHLVVGVAAGPGDPTALRIRGLFRLPDTSDLDAILAGNGEVDVTWEADPEAAATSDGAGLPVPGRAWALATVRALHPADVFTFERYTPPPPPRKAGGEVEVTGGGTFLVRGSGTSATRVRVTPPAAAREVARFRGRRVVVRGDLSEAAAEGGSGEIAADADDPLISPVRGELEGVARIVDGAFALEVERPYLDPRRVPAAGPAAEALFAAEGRQATVVGWIFGPEDDPAGDPDEVIVLGVRATALVGGPLPNGGDPVEVGDRLTAFAISPQGTHVRVRRDVGQPRSFLWPASELGWGELAAAPAGDTAGLSDHLPD